MNISPAQQLYYAWDISHKRSVSDDGRFTGVLSEAKVDLNPHQVEAALFAFKSPLSKGAILADEVGLGKTIEAGIILSELWAEYHRHILIVVPASLRNQWNIELLEKFHIPSVIMERGSYDYSLALGNKSPFDNKEKIIICSYNFAVSNADEISRIHWDLIVFDEAHKLRNVYKKENITANTLKAALKPYKKLLLTATPLQNNLKELYGLVSIIDDEFFSSAKTFDEQYNKISTRDTAKYGELKARISHIVHRTLRKQVQEYVNYTRRTPFVQEYFPSPKEEELYHRVNMYLMRDGTFGVPDSCKALLSMLVRKILSSSAYALSFTLGKIIERLQTIKENGYVETNINILFSDFEISSDEEQMPSVERTELTDSDKEQIDQEVSELKECISLARSITEETKTSELVKGLEIAFDKTAKLGAEHKALIFTESCKTQEYLTDYLKNHGYAGKIVCFNGSNNSQESSDIYRRWLEQYAGTSRVSGSSLIDKKQSLVDFFKSKAEIMIATEAGSEGINLQFCSLVVNYDMPWNPQRIEQRIGRCHRYGQKHDVVVMNFVNQSNAADRRVYELLNNKFNLFDGVFGSSDEIIGSIDSTINFEKRLNDIYQQCRTEQEINNAFDELQKELEEIITERIKQTKKSLLENFDEDVVNKLKVRQGSDTIRVNTYLQHLWLLALKTLHGRIKDINENEHSFLLEEAISPDIPAGIYTINKNLGDKIQLRYGHPLGQWIIKQSLCIEPSDACLAFDVSDYPFRSMLVEEQKGKNGYLIAYKVKAENSYDDEESIIFSAITDEGDVLPSEFGSKLLDITVSSIEEFCISSDTDKALESNFLNELEAYKNELDTRTSEYANNEIEKYEAWSKDQIVPMQDEVIELRKNKDAIHRQIRKETNVKNKLLLKREELEIGDKLRKKQQRLFNLEDEYSAKVDEMTKRLLKSMENKLETSILFKIRWAVK